MTPTAPPTAGQEPPTGTVFYRGWTARSTLMALMHADRLAWKWVAGELALAAPPTIALLIALLTTHQLTKNPVLFTSLASSAFLIYQDPMHRLNSIRAMAIAQGTGGLVGIFASLLLGPGYLTVAVAVMLTIVVLVPLHAVHPPGISSAMGFALFSPQYGALLAFIVAVGIITLLVLFHHLTVRTVLWLEGTTGIRHRDQPPPQPAGSRPFAP